MTKLAIAPLLTLDVPLTGRGPKHRQLYGALKEAILSGRLRPGTRIPATRVVAADLGISRTTVLTVFDQLAAEGYIEGKVGSGTRVAMGIPGDLKHSAARTRGRLVQADRTIARRARPAPLPDLSFLGIAARPLRPGFPDPRLLPVDVWARLSAKHWRRATRDPEHADSLGYRPLRQAIRDHIANLRGVRCDPDQVLIVAGAQQALYLSAYTLVNPGEPVWMEDPGYPRARDAFERAGARVVPVPVDAEGLVVADGRRREPAPRLIFVTPSFQCPLGSMMSLARRFELLAVAAEKKCWILEDDYFSEYRYGTNPTASLQSLDRQDRVLYVGNFSKNIVPSLRVGYIVVPPMLVDVFARVRAGLSRQPPGIDQAVLGEFIAEGHLDRHVRSTLRAYRERERVLRDSLTRYGAGLLDAAPGGTGTYLVAWLAEGLDDRRAAEQAAAAGVDVIPLSTFSMRPLRRQGLVLGYSGYDERHIGTAVRQLCAAIGIVRSRSDHS